MKGFKIFTPCSVLECLENIFFQFERVLLSQATYIKALMLFYIEYQIKPWWFELLAMWLQ